MGKGDPDYCDDSPDMLLWRLEPELSGRCKEAAEREKAVWWKDAV